MGLQLLVAPTRFLLLFDSTFHSLIAGLEVTPVTTSEVGATAPDVTNEMGLVTEAIETGVVPGEGDTPSDAAIESVTADGGDIVGEPSAADGGLIRFSFCRLLQNHTRTTSFSICSDSANMAISSEVGFGFCRKAFSSAIRTLVSILVRFFRRLPIASGVVWALVNALGLLMLLSASSSHFCNSGFNLHIFLKLKFNASNREMVVWLKSFPYNLPMANPTSP